MNRPGYATREQLKAWADSVQSQSQLPRLIRRLLLETTPGIIQLGMPADEGVASGGWDGSVRAESVTAWVPEGLSVWELSVNKSPGVKADDDYSKRDSTPDGSPISEAVYIQVILRTWSAREEWAAARCAEKKWRDVRAYGLDDVATWLEEAPLTWAWFSEELGLNPYGLQTGSAFWQSWSIQTLPTLNLELVLSGRTSNLERFEQAIARPGVTTISGGSVEEVSGFLAASAIKVDSGLEGLTLARLVFVDNLSTWRRLVDSRQPLILVPRELSFASEVKSGATHSILVPVDGSDGDINLEPLDSSEVTEVLRSLGVSDFRRSQELGNLARRSLTALRRNLAVKASLMRPAWAVGAPPREVRGILLAGSWSESTEGDLMQLEALTGLDSDQLRDRATELADPTDPFVSLSGPTWHVVSPVDAWMLLGRSITEADLGRLRTVALDVLGERDPTLGINQEDRWWKASHEGLGRKHSARLANGLAHSLAILGVYGTQLQTAGSPSGEGWSSRIVYELLHLANADQTGDLWASIAGQLPLLAEAAPGIFMDALELTLRGDDPVAKRFFNDSSETTGFGSSSIHTHVLWALETVACSPDYLSRAASLLCRLHEIDPGGRLSNRPISSLLNLMQPWYPDTAAPASSRLAVLDAIRKRNPATGWELGLALLPNVHGVHFPNRSPDYRDWEPAEKAVTRAGYIDFVSAVATRCVEDAGDSPTRWVEVLGHYANLAPDDQESIRETLDAEIAAGSFDNGGRHKLWESLRKLAADHREFPDARWSLPELEVAKLDDLIASLAPTNPRVENEWLFEDWTPHLNEVRLLDDYDAYEALLAEKREQAVGLIVDEHGIAELSDLVSSVKVPEAVGWALAAARPQFDGELLDMLDVGESSQLLAERYFARRFANKGWGWLEDFMTTHSHISPARRARLLLLSRDFPKAADLADDDPDVATYYWGQFSPYGFGPSFNGVERVATSLMQIGRNAAALRLLGLYTTTRESEAPPSYAELILEGLEKLLVVQSDGEMGALAAYDYEHLFEFVEKHRAVVNHGRLAGLEWAYLPALGFEPSVPSLFERLALNPEFFVEIVCTVYRRHSGDGKDAEADESARDRESKATNGYRLLEAWNTPPGLTLGVMHMSVLEAWLGIVQSLLQDSDRLTVGLHHVGRVLAEAPPDSDGAWPSEAVREVLEASDTDDLAEGLYLGIVNGRGVTMRSLDEGGGKERKLAEKYLQDARKIVDTAPRTAAVLRRVASSYEADARREDAKAEQFRRGLD